MEIIEYIRTIARVSPEAVQRISSSFTRKELPRKTLLFEEGQPVNSLYFIEKGLIRMYYINRQGKDITFGFYAEQHFVSIAESFFGQVPSRYYLELLENSVVYALGRNELLALIREFPEIMEIENYVLRYFLLKASERTIALQFQTAEERYYTLAESQPTILQRAPLGAIASYLGITQETLSRIRAKKA